MKKIAVLTSGGDAPGMNAAIRAVVRAGFSHGLEVFGVHHGYQGLIADQIEQMQLGSVANIIQRGGTILKTGRCQEFLQPSVRLKSSENLLRRQIEGLIVIGGDGSFRGAHELWNETQIPVIGIPGTIDNDIYGTDYTIGFDTAINTALDAIDRIRDTAASHDRLFIVEVMGRNSGFIAIAVGLAGGAEEVFIPEAATSVDVAIQHIQRGMKRGKASSILVTGEGQKPGRAYDLAEAIRKKAGYDAKVCVLGHVQRGGTPTAFDRILGCRLGAEAVARLKAGDTDKMVGFYKGEVVTVSLQDATTQKHALPGALIELARILAN
jgi:6-phosphofructokinase 1